MKGNLLLLHIPEKFRDAIYRAVVPFDERHRVVNRSRVKVVRNDAIARYLDKHPDQVIALVTAARLGVDR